MYNKKKEDGSVTGTNYNVGGVGGQLRHPHHDTPTVYHIEKDHEASRRKRMRLRFMFWLFMFILLGLLITVGCCMCRSKSEGEGDAAASVTANFDPAQVPEVDGIYSGLYDY